MNVKKMIFPVLSLFLICLTVSVLLALTNDLTADKIAQQEADALRESMQSVIPDADSFSESNTEGIYAAYKSGKNIGWAIKVTVKGYGGDMTVLVGIGNDDVIKGVSILSHSETPGMGAKADDDDYLSQYTGKNAETLTLGADIDAVTGATVTSSALIGAVNEAIEIYDTVKVGE
ncbi:MAG TPA: RnfABCDGE type electron transport complex subunit G [Bacillota bacterium]|nr:RnfABCDGE type electron transport complex subunit G [Bacillota bacterium]